MEDENSDLKCPRIVSPEKEVHGHLGIHSPLEHQDSPLEHERALVPPPSTEEGQETDLPPGFDTPGNSLCFKRKAASIEPSEPFMEHSGVIQTPKEHACSVCMQALSSNLTHHHKKEKNEPPLSLCPAAAPNQLCLGCREIFSLGEEKPLPPTEEKKNKLVHDFDLNELPPPEE